MLPSLGNHPNLRSNFGRSTWLPLHHYSQFTILLTFVKADHFVVYSEKELGLQAMYNFIHGWTIKYQTKFIERKHGSNFFLQRRQLTGGPNFFSIETVTIWPTLATLDNWKQWGNFSTTKFQFRKHTNLVGFVKLVSSFIKIICFWAGNHKSHSGSLPQFYDSWIWFVRSERLFSEIYLTFRILATQT